MLSGQSNIVANFENKTQNEFDRFIFRFPPYIAENELSFKGPFTLAIFVVLLYATFAAPEFCDENRKRKLAAISMRFVAAMSRRFRTGSKLHATWWRFKGKLK